MSTASQSERINVIAFRELWRAAEAREWSERRQRAHQGFSKLPDDAADEAARSKAALDAAAGLIDLECSLASVDDAAALRAAKTRLAAREATHSTHLEDEALHVTPQAMTEVLLSCVDLLTEDGFIAALAGAERVAGYRLSGPDPTDSPISMVNDVGETMVLCCASATEKMIRSRCGIRVTKNAHRRLMLMQPSALPGRTRKKGHTVSVGPYTPPLGGPQINQMLTELCEWIGARLEQMSGIEDRQERYAFAVAVSGIAHIRFESIHPFIDGNGRLGRSLAEAILAAALPKHLRAPIGVASAFSHPEPRNSYYRSLDSCRDHSDHFVGWWAHQVEMAADTALRIIQGCRLVRRVF